MKKTKVIVNGLPGKMAQAVANAVIGSEDLELIPKSLTGPEILMKSFDIDEISIELFAPDDTSFLLIPDFPDIIIDFTLPSAIKQNVDFYAKNKLPFVMGTTGGDLEYIREKVQKSGLNAVVAPNMAKPIVVFQAMMEFAALNFPGALNGFSAKIVESHQKTKVDTSGTAKSLVNYITELGAPISVIDIEKKRTEADYEALGIPKEHWDGHGWHTYSLEKGDGSVSLQFTHNVNGRQVYVDGALDAARFLSKVEEHFSTSGRVFSMIDVLKANW